MIYIFEGPDGAGKSTQANALSKITGMPVMHFSNPKSEEEKKQMFEMYKQKLLLEDNVIFDRSWYSDMVYGPVLRGGSTITVEQCKELEAIVKSKGGKVIYMTNTLPVLIERAFGRGEDLVKEEQFANIAFRYDALFLKERDVEVVKLYA